MIHGILFAILATMLWAPGTASDVALRRVIVESLIARLQRISRGQVIVTAALLSAVAIVVGILGTDGAMISQMAAPEVIAWLTAFDIATIVDGLVITATVAVGARGTKWWRAIVPRIRPPRNRARRRRRSCKVTRLPANDDNSDPVPLAA